MACQLWKLVIAKNKFFYSTDIMPRLSFKVQAFGSFCSLPKGYPSQQYDDVTNKSKVLASG
jgi:hypothetical protein